jgi:hypothetical protein
MGATSDTGPYNPLTVFDMPGIVVKVTYNYLVQGNIICNGNWYVCVSALGRKFLVQRRKDLRRFSNRGTFRTVA